MQNACPGIRLCVSFAEFKLHEAAKIEQSDSFRWIYLLLSRKSFSEYVTTNTILHSAA
jgi:hypothetical protein